MRVILVVIAAVVVAAAALAAQSPGPLVVHVPVDEPAWMVLSGAGLIAAASALKRAA